jgi:formate hydrogenlyase transcriptional activator
MDATVGTVANIRELQNLVERAVILSREGVLQNPLQKTRAAVMSSTHHSSPTYTSSMTLEISERALILETLEQVGWIVGGPHGAALKLGLKRTTLMAKMRRMGISRPIPHGGSDLFGLSPIATEGTLEAL